MDQGRHRLTRRTGTSTTSRVSSRPVEVACIWTEDKNHSFMSRRQAAYKFLSETTDAKGRKLKVHKLCLTKKPCLLEGADTIDAVEGTIHVRTARSASRRI